MKDVKEEEFEPQELAAAEEAEPEKPVQATSSQLSLARHGTTACPWLLSLRGQAALEEADSEAVEESNVTNNVSPVAVAALDQDMHKYAHSAC